MRAGLPNREPGWLEDGKKLASIKTETENLVSHLFCMMAHPTQTVTVSVTL